MNRVYFLVSIIIPCYNVERYVEQCLRSIMNQSYNKLEIIAVDDGSLDGSPQILDKLANEDYRIKVIHKQNAGVSVARNNGLDVATGDYVVFVDGDDYLAKDYVDYMLRLANENDSDFVMSQDCFTQKNDTQIQNDVFSTLTSTQATALLLSPRVIVGCWNKMFKKKFLDENKLRFSTKLFYGEGLNFITKAAGLANSVTLGKRKVYYYRRNNESSATTKFNIQKYYNGESALNEIEKELVSPDYTVTQMMALHKSLFCLGALSQTYAHSLQKTFKVDCGRWKSTIRTNLPQLIKSDNVSFYRKVLLLGGLYFPNIICRMDMWRRKRISKCSVN